MIKKNLYFILIFCNICASSSVKPWMNHDLSYDDFIAPNTNKLDAIIEKFQNMINNYQANDPKVLERLPLIYDILLDQEYPYDFVFDLSLSAFTEDNIFKSLPKEIQDLCKDEKNLTQIQEYWWKNDYMKDKLSSDEQDFLLAIRKEGRYSKRLIQIKTIMQLKIKQIIEDIKKQIIFNLNLRFTNLNNLDYFTAWNSPLEELYMVFRFSQADDIHLKDFIENESKLNYSMDDYMNILKPVDCLKSLIL